jgi:hypothetical protein
MVEKARKRGDDRVCILDQAASHARRHSRQFTVDHNPHASLYASVRNYIKIAKEAYAANR